MKSACFLKDCDNFNGDFDCILHYSKIQIDAQQKIVLHYKAMRSRMEEMLNNNNNNAKFQGVPKKKCTNQFDSICSIINNRVDDTLGDSDSPSSATSLGSRTSSQGTVKRASVTGKENSLTKKSRKSARKELLKDISIDSRPSKEKRTKQTKLPFFKTSSARKRCSQDDFFDDDDLTYCEELERSLLNAKSPAIPKCMKETTDLFDFGRLENFRARKSKEKTSTTVENQIEKPKEVTPQKVLGVKIKEEKSAEKSFRTCPTPLSPDLFLSDMSNSNSVIFIEPQEKEVVSIPDLTYNPRNDLFQEIERNIIATRNKNKLYEDSNPIPTPPKVPIEERDMYEGECLDCQLFYDCIVEKRSLSEANTEINNCPIKCDGWKERCKKLRKDDKEKTRKNGMVIIKCNSKFARRRKEDPVNETAPGFWDLEVEPRKSKPLFCKKDENYDTPDL